MTSKLYFQDDSIQLIELASSQGSAENVQSPSALHKFKKKNKVQSPSVPSSNLSFSSSSKISDVFIVRQDVETGKNNVTPIPAPRSSRPKSDKIIYQIPDVDRSDVSDLLNEKIKKSSDTIDTLSGDIQSLFSLKSETLSYKEKLRNRFLSVKKEAENSIIQRHSAESRTSKSKKFSDANDTVFQNENNIINAELIKYDENKSNRRVDVNSGYDFFCSNNDTEVQHQENKNLPYDVHEDDNKDITTEQQSEQIVTENSDTSKQSLIDILGTVVLEATIVEYVRAKEIDLASYEKDVFWVPHRSSIDKHNWTKYKIRLTAMLFTFFYNLKFDKLDDKNVFELRNLEEEGLYKTENPHISKRALYVLEQRLLADENRDWFGEDGQLKFLPDPRVEKSYKPIKNGPKNSDFIKEYVRPTVYEPLMNLNINDNTLEIVIQDIHFRHHPLFSKEHVLTHKLITLYGEYKKGRAANTYLVYSKRLEVLRSAKSQLENRIQSAGDNEVVEAQILRLNKYISEIKITRSRMYEEGRKDRDHKRSILYVWKALKSTRASQGYSNTSVKLVIKKEYNDYKKEAEIWERNFSQEVAELLEEHDENFAAEMRDYKQQLNEWKMQRKNINSDEELEESEVMIERPKKPKRKYNEEDIRAEVLDKCNLSLKPPGEPLLDFELNNENVVTKEVNDSKEKLRRCLVNKTLIFVKVLYNTREICKTKTFALNDTFTCNLNEQISIKIYNIPKSIKMEIYEQTNKISKRILAECSLSIPSVSTVRNSIDAKRELFVNKEVVKPSHTAVGTGFDVNDVLATCELELQPELMYLTGTIGYNIGWSADNNEKQCISAIATSSYSIPTLIPTDIKHLKKWIKNYPDPQDPQNSLFYDYIKNFEDTENDKDYFRLNPDLKPFEFCDAADLDNNVRFKLLKLRDNNEPEFKGLVVPNRVKEIPQDIFTSYEKRCNEETITTATLTEKIRDVDCDHIDAQRKWANKYLQQAENKIIHLSKIAERRITLKDVLNEESIPSIGSLGLTFMNWLQPKRPLRPVRKTAKNVPVTTTFKEMKIMVNIVGAIQVPVRKDMDITASTTKSDSISTIAVRPFVMVSFQDDSVSTTVAEGPNPIWNQELNLPLQNLDGNFTSSTLLNIRDSLYFNLYDETVDDLIEDDRIRETNIHQQLGCNWLGRIEIPFSTLLYKNRIEGTFKVNLPPVLLGYERQSIKSFHATGEPITQKIDTFLTVFITLQPSVANLQQQLKNDLECNELQYVEQYITNWQNQFNTAYPHRQFSAFVTNISGETCCITRYLKPVKPPKLDPEMSGVTEQHCAKYVSLIPFRENSTAGIIPDIWLTAEQVLTLMMGSIRDHAVLLTCYFLALGMKAWLLLGFSMSHGFTAYVLTRENELPDHVYYIYDVTTAQKYNVYDNFCPLHKVFCVINDENVWGNIQDEDRLHMTKFDLTKSSEWQQLFGREISCPASVFQQVNLEYALPSSVTSLQEKIEKKLRRKIMKWRKHNRTVWNHYCNATFKKILPRLEAGSLRNTDLFSSPEHLIEIQSLLGSYQMRGFAVSFPYANVTAIVNFLQATGIHLNENPNIEFSLTVYIHPYPNNALVVWIYVATLISRR